MMEIYLYPPPTECYTAVFDIRTNLDRTSSFEACTSSSYPRGKIDAVPLASDENSLRPFHYLAYPI